MILGARGVLLCCMALSASGVYHLTAEELRQVCLERGLDSSGPVREKARSKVARRYDADRKPHQYRVGDTVVYRLHVVSSKAQNISAKLAMRWSRPVVITKVVGPNSVLLANPDTGVVVRRAHVSQLKPFVL